MGMPSARFNYGLNVFFSFYKSYMCITELLENTGNFKKEEKMMTHWNNFTFISFQSFCLHMGFKI